MNDVSDYGNDMDNRPENSDEEHRGDVDDDDERMDY